MKFWQRKKKSKREVILMAPLPPPVGGMASLCQELIQNGLPNNYQLRHLDTRIIGRRGHYKKPPILIEELFRAARIFAKLLAFLIGRRPVLVHFYISSVSSSAVFRDLGFILLIRLLQVPLVCQYHTDIRLAKGKSIYCAMLKIVYHLSNKVLLFNSESFTFLNKITNDSSKIKIVANFINDRWFEVPRLSAKDQKACKVFYAGNITKLKGSSDIFLLAKKMPYVHFYMAGQIISDMEKNIKQLPANVFLLGVLDPQQIAKELSTSNIFLFPSYSEAFPISLIEAMAAGLPIVSTNIAAIENMIKPSGAILVAPGDIQGFENAINDLIAHPEKQTSMGDANKKRSFELYSYRKVTTYLTNIYTEVLFQG
jgi:glycosyltransferase involved in cell wall biosynthesis